MGLLKEQVEYLWLCLAADIAIDSALPYLSVLNYSISFSGIRPDGTCG